MPGRTRTREIFPTPLSASQTSSFLSIFMLRTVPPPPGIGHVSNLFVSGLNRTGVFFVSFVRIVAPLVLLLALVPMSTLAFKEGPYPNVTGGFGEQSCHLLEITAAGVSR